MAKAKRDVITEGDAQQKPTAEATKRKRRTLTLTLQKKRHWQGSASSSTPPVSEAFEFWEDIRGEFPTEAEAIAHIHAPGEYRIIHVRAVKTAAETKRIEFV